MDEGIALAERGDKDAARGRAGGCRGRLSGRRGAVAGTRRTRCPGQELGHRGTSRAAGRAGRPHATRTPGAFLPPPSICAIAISRHWPRGTCIGEPRVDLVDIQGLAHTRYLVIANAIGLSPRQLLTPDALRVAQKRVRDVPCSLDRPRDLPSDRKRPRPSRRHCRRTSARSAHLPSLDRHRPRRRSEPRNDRGAGRTSAAGQTPSTSRGAGGSIGRVSRRRTQRRDLAASGNSKRFRRRRLSDRRRRCSRKRGPESAGNWATG